MEPRYNEPLFNEALVITNDILRPSTVEPRYNEPLFNEALVITNGILRPSTVEPRYNERYSSPQYSETST